MTLGVYVEEDGHVHPIEEGALSKEMVGVGSVATY